MFEMLICYSLCYLWFRWSRRKLHQEKELGLLPIRAEMAAKETVEGGAAAEPPPAVGRFRHRTRRRVSPPRAAPSIDPADWDIDDIGERAAWMAYNEAQGNMAFDVPVVGGPRHHDD